MNFIADWFIGGFVNWKTTLTGFATALLVFLNGAGYIHLSNEQQATVVSALLIMFSWFAKDSNSTGKPTDENIKRIIKNYD